jgi:hypothetical protein
MKIEYVIYDEFNDSVLTDPYGMIMTFKDISHAVEFCDDNQLIISSNMLPEHWKEKLIIDKLTKSN